MRIATWNVNSLNARLARVEEWLGIGEPDVLCLQETKLANDAFPHLTFGALGYESVHFGEGRWNGVAILSKVGISDVSTGFGGLPDSYPGEARCIVATCGDVRIINLYCPNGREVGTEFYDRKLEWFSQLRSYLDANEKPSSEIAVVGDFNVAPQDRDVWSMKAFEGATHVTPDERAALQNVCDFGLHDALRTRHPNQDNLFSFWNYQGGDFHQGRGMRIDHILVTEPMLPRLEWVLVDRNARKGEKPSDHAPLFADFS